MQFNIHSWDDRYRETPPWDIGRPQPEFVRLFKDGEIKPGRILDAGCGTGENALFLAENGCSVAGIDVAHRAIELARKKAKDRHIKADFFICDALTLTTCFPPGEFDTIIDSGLFHTLEDAGRPVYMEQICKVLKDGGHFFMMCFSDKQPGDWGPRRVSKQEIMQALLPPLRINYIKEKEFETTRGDLRPKAYLVSATKIIL